MSAVLVSSAFESPELGGVMNIIHGRVTHRGVSDATDTEFHPLPFDRRSSLLIADVNSVTSMRTCSVR